MAKIKVNQRLVYPIREYYFGFKVMDGVQAPPKPVILKYSADEVIEQKISYITKMIKDWRKR